MMRVLQVQYTSCRRGQGAGSGFQVRSASDGIEPSELAEIARLGNYRAPTGAGDRTEGGSGYPVVLRYMRLESGRWVLVHAVYSGLDYSGRAGNFMAHSLLVEAGTLPRLATDYLNWSGWKTALADGEDTTEAPPKLEALEMPLPAAVPVRRLDMAQKALLADMLAALFFVQPTGRKIVIRADAEQGALWIETLLKALPLRHALGLSVSLYQFDSIDCAQINATVPGTRFSFNQTQKDLEYFVFEPRTGLKSALPNTDPGLKGAAMRYGEAIADMYFTDPARLEKYKSFAGGFAHDAVDAWLSVGLALFSHRDSDRDIAAAEFAGLAEFVERFTPPGQWPRSVDLLVGLLEKHSGRPAKSSIVQILEIALKAAGQGGDMATVREMGFSAWQELLVNCVADATAPAADVDSYWERLTKTFSIEAGVKTLAQADLGERLQEYYPSMPADRFSVVGRYRMIAQGPRRGVVTSPDMAALLTAAAARSDGRAVLTAIFSTFGDLNDTAEAIEFLNGRRAPDALLAQVVQQISASRRDQGWPLRHHLYRNGAENLLRLEFGALIGGGNTREKFTAYCDAAAKAAPEYWRGAASDLVAIYWQHLSPDARRAQAAAWIDSQLPDFAAAPLRREAIQMASEAIGFDMANRANAALVARVRAAAIAEKVTLSPDRPALYDALRELGKAKNARDILRVGDTVQRRGGGLSDAEYSYLTRMGVAKLFELEPSEREVSALMSALFEGITGYVQTDPIGKEVAAMLKSRKLRRRLPNLVAGSIDAVIAPTHSASPLLTKRIALELAGASYRHIQTILAATEKLLLRWPPATRDPGLARLDEMVALVRANRRTVGNYLRTAFWRLLGR